MKFDDWATIGTSQYLIPFYVEMNFCLFEVPYKISKTKAEILAQKLNTHKKTIPLYLL